MTSLTATERLEAIEAIRALKGRYFLHLDRKEWDAWRALFTDDAVMDSSSEFPDAPDPSVHILRGADTILAGVSRFVRNMVTVHHGFTPVINVADADNATAIWAFEDYLYRANGALLHGFGHYDEVFRRVGGAWRIAAIRVSRLKVVKTAAAP